MSILLKKYLFGACVSTVGMCVVCFYGMAAKPNKHTVDLRRVRPVSDSKSVDLTYKPLLKIHSWSTRAILGIPDPWAREGKASEDYHCKLLEHDCMFVKQRSEYNTSEVVVFNIFNTQIGDIPRYRPPGQLWIFFIHESPQKTSKQKLAQWKNSFNASSSYMLTRTDISEPFPRYTSGNHSKWKIAQLEKIRRNLTVKVKQKKKMVAWFVSNCKTSSARENYVRELSIHIRVDVFGKCGNLTCPRTVESKYGDCDTMLDKHYKFYLAFENSLCDEYVTEKFTRMVHRDVIPVVLGGADFSEFTAPETYLNVRNFTSPRYLAEFMRYLDKRTDLYVDYLMRKRSMVRRKLNNTSACGLCDYAHRNLHRKKQVNAEEIWNVTKLCKTADEFYKGII